MRHRTGRHFCVVLRDSGIGLKGLLRYQGTAPVSCRELVTGSGRETIKPMHDARSSAVNTITLAGLPLYTITSQLKIIAVTAIRFAGLAIAFSLYQSRSEGPKRSWRSSHHLNFADACEPAQTETSRNGVVGSIGKKAPIRPIAKVVYASNSHSVRIR